MIGFKWVHKIVYPIHVKWQGIKNTFFKLQNNKALKQDILQFSGILFLTFLIMVSGICLIHQLDDFNGYILLTLNMIFFFGCCSVFYFFDYVFLGKKLEHPIDIVSNLYLSLMNYWDKMGAMIVPENKIVIAIQKSEKPKETKMVHTHPHPPKHHHPSPKKKKGKKKS